MVRRPSIYRFGPYEYNSRARELYKRGIKLKLRPQPAKVLEILLESQGNVVTREDLRQSLWPQETFVDFEQGLNTSVKELRAVLNDHASDPHCIETLPKLGYRLLGRIEIIGLPQPDSAILTEIAGKEGSRNKIGRQSWSSWARTNGRLLTATFVLGVALVGWSLWFISRPRPSHAAGRLLVAVLPFDNLTGDAAEDYFSDGLTEEMIVQLGQVDPQHLGVIARTSVMHYKQSKLPLPQIGHELGVHYVVEGSVRRDSGRVRITVELIQMNDQASVWSQTYDRDLNGLLSLEHDIAWDVAGETALMLDKGRKSASWDHTSNQSPNSYEAYDLYLKGRYFWNKRTKDGFERAAEYFQQAIARDPQYAQAYAGLADTYGLMSTWRLAPPGEFMAKARTAALHSLEIDDTVAEAHASLALVLENHDYDWPGAEKEFRRAIELEPGYATAHQWYAECLSWQGRFDEALAESERARQLDPLSLIIATDHGAILYFARQYDRAIEQFRAVLDMDPNFDRARILLAFVYTAEGRFAEARDDIEYRDDPDDPAMTWASRVYVYGRWGRKAEAQRALSKVVETIRTSKDDPAPAMLFAYLGLNERDQALALLQKACLEHSNAVVDAKAAPYLDSLRSDPRFQKILVQIGF